MLNLRPSSKVDGKPSPPSFCGCNTFQAHGGAAALLPACRPVDDAADALGSAEAAAEAGACASLARQVGEEQEGARLSDAGLLRCGNDSRMGPRRWFEQADGERLQQHRPLQPFSVSEKEAQQQEHRQLRVSEQLGEAACHQAGGVQGERASVDGGGSSLTALANDRDGCSEGGVKIEASAPGDSTITSLLPAVRALHGRPDAMQAPVAGGAAVSTCGSTSRIEGHQVAGVSLPADVEVGVGWETKARAEVTAGKDANGFAFFQFNIPQGKRRKRDSSRVPVQGEG